MKQPIMSTAGKLIPYGTVLLTLLAASCAAHKTKCFTPCRENVKAHIPIITCQPLDAVVERGKAVTLSIQAKGRNLKFLWYAKIKGKSEFTAVDGGTAASLTVSPDPANYGLYYCVVSSERDDGDIEVVESRWASVGGPSDLGSGGAGGDFVPVQNPVTAGTVTTICGHPVSGHWDRFPGTDTPATGQTALQCSILNVSVSPNVTIPNTGYYLQWWVTAANTSCCTNWATGTDYVACNVTPGLTYRFIAHFKAGYAPPDGTVLELQGHWLP